VAELDHRERNGSSRLPKMVSIRSSVGCVAEQRQTDA